MWKLCKHDNEYVKDNFMRGNVDSITTSCSNLVDDIILFMNDLKVLDSIKNGIVDKRRHNKLVPMDLIMILSIASKMRINTSLTDIPYAIQDHRTLSMLGYNLINDNNRDNGIITEGTIRYLINKFNKNDFIHYYNNVVQNHIMKDLDIQPNIHILDCTKVKVNINNKNYENSSIAYDHNTNEPYRGYKLSTLRGVVDDVGVLEEIRFGTASIHDLTLSDEMLRTTPLFKHGDILINDRGFLSRDLINYLKTERGVDTYVPLRKSMQSYDIATKVARRENKWNKHPFRDNQYITLVDNLKDFWRSDDISKDVDINACVLWDKNIDKYFAFITTDTTKSAKDIILTYELRPEIEEDYRQLKDFWRLEDFKSTKEHFIVFHIICTLLGYLFYQLFIIFHDENEKYIGKSFPVLLKNYHSKSLSHFIIYYNDCFAILELSELLLLFSLCDTFTQSKLLEYFSK